MYPSHWHASWELISVVPFSSMQRSVIFQYYLAVVQLWHTSYLQFQLDKHWSPRVCKPVLYIHLVNDHHTITTSSLRTTNDKPSCSSYLTRFSLQSVSRSACASIFWTTGVDTLCLTKVQSRLHQAVIQPCSVFYLQSTNGDLWDSIHLARQHIVFPDPLKESKRFPDSQKSLFWVDNNSDAFDKDMYTSKCDHHPSHHQCMFNRSDRPDC